MALIEKVKARQQLLKQCGWRNVRLAYKAIKDQRAHQLLQELAPFYRVVSQLRPAAILEIGVAEGGMFITWPKLAAPDAMVLGIDPKPPPLSNIIKGYSQDPEVCKDIKQRLNRPLDLLFIDGDHRYESVLADVTMYSPLVRSGGIIALHDIQPSSPGSHAYSGEVYRLWEELKATEHAFEIVSDKRQEGYGIGYFYKQ